MKSIQQILKKNHRSIAIGVVLATIFATQPAAAADPGIIMESPSDVFYKAIKAIMGEITQIASLVLFGYGFFQIFKMGVGSDTSGAVKKLGISWGIGIVLSGWDTFFEFFNNEADVTAGMAVPYDLAGDAAVMMAPAIDTITVVL